MTYLEALLQRASGNLVDLPEPTRIDYSAPVEPEGSLDARIVVVGESLGYEEEEQRRPFVGKLGRKLKGHMRLAGIHPEKCRILNVYPFYPIGGSIDNVDPEVLREWQARTLGEVERCCDARVVVAVGNLALATFTGTQDITRRRGSVYDWRGKKVLGMIHPAAVLRRAEFEKHCRLDWERVKLLSTDHETHHMRCGCAVRQKRVHITPYSDKALFWDTLKRYHKSSENPQKVLAIDIETPKIQGKRQIVCVSFAFTPDESLVLPFTEVTKAAIQALCESPCIKVGHNFVSFDRWWLKKVGIEVGGEIRDTLALHHCLDPASAHSLEYLTSIYTWEPWYKDEGKGHDITLIEADREGYFRYCGLDSCCTMEIHDILWPELIRRGKLDFYRKHYEALYDPILDLMTRGVHIDHTKRAKLLEELLGEARQSRDTLSDLAGGPLYTLGTQRDRKVFDALASSDPLQIEIVRQIYGEEALQTSLARLEKKTVSNAQLKNLLYNTLGLPTQLKRRKGGEETATADAVALRKLRLQYASRQDVCDVIDLAMTHNKAQKLASFLYPNTFDEDGMFRFTLKLNTEAARLASSAAPNGLGRNSQNTARDTRIRSVILPDPGHVLLEADLSQVEGRICFVRAGYLTGDTDLIRLGRLRSSEFDQHKYVASLVFKKSVTDILRPERQVSKSIGHGSQRAMQGLRMSETLMKDGFVYTVEECDALIEEYHKAFPAIRLWQQQLRKIVRAYKQLVNSWQRVWDVKYEEVVDELFRRAYSWLLQSECAECTNQMGFIPLWRWLKKERMQSRILMHEHDSLVCSCALDEVYDVACFMKGSLEVEHDYDGVGLIVPVEYGLGMNYGEKTEFKELPSREEFEATAKNLLLAA